MKEASDPKADGFLRVEDVVQNLASGWGLCCESGTGFDSDEWFVQKTAGKVRHDTMQRLIDEGWLERHGSRGWKLSDAGHAAYMRSTDELGDGVLSAPRTTVTTETK